MISEKTLTSLEHKKYRDKSGLFLVEGPDIIEHCLKNDYPLQELLVDDNLKTKYNYEIIQARKKNVPVNFMAIQNLSKFADTVTTQGLLAVAKIRKTTTIDDPGLSVYLDCVQDPGNVGAVIRSAAGSCFKTVIAGRGTADFFNPKVIRSSAGGFANVNLVDDSDGTLLSKLKEKGYNIIITDCKRGKDYRTIDKSKKNLIVMGNEGEGVSESVANFATHRVNIPMNESMKSLNIAVAFGVLAFSLMPPMR